MSEPAPLEVLAVLTDWLKENGPPPVEDMPTDPEGYLVDDDGGRLPEAGVYMLLAYQVYGMTGIFPGGFVLAPPWDAAVYAGDPLIIAVERNTGAQLELRKDGSLVTDEQIVAESLGAWFQEQLGRLTRGEIVWNEGRKGWWPAPDTTRVPEATGQSAEALVEDVLAALLRHGEYAIPQFGSLHVQRFFRTDLRFEGDVPEVWTQVGGVGEVGPDGQVALYAAFDALLQERLPPRPIKSNPPGPRGIPQLEPSSLRPPEPETFHTVNPPRIPTPSLPYSDSDESLWQRIKRIFTGD